mmetsp:Transcript_130739/g.254799  ORF Transcript_130739/g.254799 Transcript_130739/m.254799 type:complete len:190 (+) Transcript_130739:90-659(+)
MLMQHDSDTEEVESEPTTISTRMASAGRRFLAALPFVLVGGAICFWASMQHLASHSSSPTGPVQLDAEVQVAGSECSAEDHAFLVSVKEEEQEFYRQLTICAKGALNWFFAWNADTFTDCQRRSKYGKISDRCLGCFAMNSRFVFDNCKIACLSNWCSESCLTCADQNEKRFAQCVGKVAHEVPEAHVC